MYLMFYEIKILTNEDHTKKGILVLLHTRRVTRRHRKQNEDLLGHQHKL